MRQRAAFAQARLARLAACRKERDCEELRDQGLESPRIDYNDELSITTGYQQVLDATGGTLDALYNNGAFAML